MDKLIRGLRTFQTSYFCRHQELFEQLSHGQAPRILFIACSDSRVDPNLITQSQIGDLFVIRNAGNIVPPYGAANGGEGAAIEYAVQALNVQHIVVCGHSHCGAMKGLLKLDSIRASMPLVYEWLEHAEATRRLVKENYSDREGEELMEITVAENVLTQLENLRTYPVIHARLARNELNLHAWVYHIETGTVVAYDPETHGYVDMNDHIPACDLVSQVARSDSPAEATYANPSPSRAQTTHWDSTQHPHGAQWLAPAQADRIYRGSVRS